ncbi:MAG: hypothetical protein KF824_06110 [Fimbriimonadaceae bacterium]|nr:MAG: hypothetical protein KF824_06110 [Fimbriimonadaceae bacterium]
MKTKICLAIAILCSVVIAGCGGIKAYVPGSGLCSEIFAYLQTTTLSGDDIDIVDFYFSLSEIQGGIQADAAPVQAGETVTVSVGGLPQGVTIDLNGDGNSTTIQLSDEGPTVVEVTLESNGSVPDGEYQVTVLLQRDGCEDVQIPYTIYLEEFID